MPMPVEGWGGVGVGGVISQNALQLVLQMQAF